MVSSLPFLAPVFVRKAKEYRSKMSKDSKGSSSDGAGQSGNRLGSGRAGEMYKLGSRSRGASESNGAKGTYSVKVTETDPNSSEELVLQGSYGDNDILKSVSYSVRVDEGMGRPRAGSRSDFRRL